MGQDTNKFNKCISKIHGPKVEDSEERMIRCDLVHKLTKLPLSGIVPTDFIDASNEELYTSRIYRSKWAIGTMGVLIGKPILYSVFNYMRRKHQRKK